MNVYEIDKVREDREGLKFKVVSWLAERAKMTQSR